MGLMMLALGAGVEFFVKADGKKEDEALETLEKLVKNNFDIDVKK